MTELVVAIGMSAVLGAAALGFFRSQTRALGNQSLTLDATDKVRAAMTLIVQELRETAYDPTAGALISPGFKGVRYAGPSAVWIELDRNGDGAIRGDATDPNAESIIYSYDAAGQRILRTTAGVAETLISDVPAGAIVFRYYDEAGSELPPVATSAAAQPPGYPTLPAVVSQALDGASALDASNRDAIASLRVTLQVPAASSSFTTTLGMSTRVSVPNRILDRL